MLGFGRERYDDSEGEGVFLMTCYERGRAMSFVSARTPCEHRTRERENTDSRKDRVLLAWSGIDGRSRGRGLTRTS